MSLNHRLLSVSDWVNGLVEKLLLAAGIAILLLLFAQVLARHLGESLSWSEEVGS